MAFLEGYSDSERNSLSNVFYTMVFPHCEFNDILRFRRVGKVAKEVLVQDYLRGHPKLVPELEINETDERNVNKFLAMNIPVTKVYLNNEESQQEFYDKWKSGLEEFLGLHSEKITNLRVHTLRVRMDDEESKFFKRFTRLEHLSAKNLVYYETVKSMSSCELNFTTPIQDVFKNLKSIDFGFEDVFKHPILTRTVTTHAPELISNCHLTLESIALPYTPFLQSRSDKSRDFIARRPDILSAAQIAWDDYRVITSFMEEMIEFLSGSGHNQQAPSKMKRISFEHFHYADQNVSKDVEAFCAQKKFIPLATKCFELGVTLEKVNSAWMQRLFWYPNPPNDWEKAVVSMVDIRPCVVINKVRLDNLEELVVNTSTSRPGERSRVFPLPLFPPEPDYARRPEWGKLKTLKIIQDSSCLHFNFPLDDLILRENWLAVPFPEDANVEVLFEFLFVEDSPPPFQELTELSLEFKDVSQVYEIPNRVVDDIVRCCGTVKKIELTNWSGSDEGVVKLFGGMESLEEVVIRKCKNLGNGAFVGKEAANPVFLRLKKMKKLSLLGLDEMPKLTDFLFRCVISKMNLSHLVLSSEKPITNVSQDGIRSLLNGPFAESIVKFPFTGWSLNNCSSDEFHHLSQQFRSSNML